MANPRSLAWYHANKHRINKEARKKYMEDYYKNNPPKKISQQQRDKNNAARRKKYLEDPDYREAVKLKVKEWTAGDPSRKKKQRLRKYKLTIEEYNLMLTKQKFKCAICNYDNMTTPNFFPLVDHCHASHVVRGLLCMNCNQALGKLKDSIENLSRAIKYLKRHKCSN